MGDINCESWNSSPECFNFDEPPEFIRPPPSFFCDGSFDEQFTCSNDIPFPFQINTDRIGEEPTLAIALVCAILISVLLTVSGVLLWRNRQRVFRHFRCFGSSSDSTRKSTPSAASTSDDSDGTGYSDNIDYRKRALLSSISPPTGVKFLTESSIRYAPHQHTHLTLDGGHIYEEIPNNYPPFYCQNGAAGRHALSRGGAPINMSWVDLLQRPPCSDIAPNLYMDGVKTSACPNCYYPTLPRDSSRLDGSKHTLNVVANPVATALASARAKRTTIERSSAYQFPASTRNGYCSSNYTFTGTPQHHHIDLSLVRNDLRREPCDAVSERTRTLDSNRQRRQQKRYNHINQNVPGNGRGSYPSIECIEEQEPRRLPENMFNGPVCHVH